MVRRHNSGSLSGSPSSSQIPPLPLLFHRYLSVRLLRTAEKRSVGSSIDEGAGVHPRAAQKQNFKTPIRWSISAKFAVQNCVCPKERSCALRGVGSADVRDGNDATGDDGGCGGGITRTNRNDDGGGNRKRRTPKPYLFKSLYRTTLYTHIFMTSLSVSLYAHGHRW